MNSKGYSNLIKASLLAALVLMACSFPALLVTGRTVRGSGNVVEETRPVSGVTGVNLSTIGTLTIEVGNTESLRIEAEDNLMEHLETVVLNGSLRIGTRNNVNLRNTQPVNYYLTVISLDRIKISSAGDIQAPDMVAERFSIDITSSGDLQMGDLEADSLSVKISSSGDMSMGVLNANLLEVDISSSGDLVIEGGQVEKQNITISSNGKYTAQDLASNEAEVRLTSSGTATIWVQDKLQARLTSSGDLRYRGDPTVNVTSTSSGEVIQIGE